MQAPPHIFVKKALLGLFVAIVIVLTSAMAYRLALYPGSSLAPILFTAILGAFILYRPIIGMALYFILYPLVPGSGEVNMLKTSMLGLTLLMLGIWFYQKMKYGQLQVIYAKYKYMYLFFLYLLFSILLSGYGNYSVMDWARDIASLLNLLLIPVLVDYLEDRKNYWLVYLIFVPMALGILQNIFMLLAVYGVPFVEIVFRIPYRFNIFHPSWVFAIGATMYLLKAPPRPVVWLYFALAGLVVTFLTPGRTIWITTLMMAGLMLFFISKYRRQAVVLIVVASTVMGYMVVRGLGSSNYGQLQTIRFSQIVEYHKDISIQNRINEAQQAGQLFISSPVWGVGFGYQYRFWRFITGKGYGYMDTNYTHNDIINIAAKGGLAGLLLFGLMIAGFYRALLKRKYNLDEPLAAGWAAVGLIILTSSLITGLSTPIFQTRTAMFGLLFVLSLGLGYKPPPKDEDG
jgi:O-antigen ligase